MIKSSLVEAIAKKNPNINSKNIEQMLNILLEEITNALIYGRRVELRGFGTFAVKKRIARLRRSPYNKKVMPIQEKWIPFFRSGKNLKERLNENYNPK
ncbi:HU family DNA-binding protein [Candidatus Liberibacter americanus]|uniref:Bacterial nucleoid DNA-binding protein n=1 Tax=Candidatus Liberibacter americanus str. Sao Paulo TaxID=1261131 RepID=U6B3F0_9HYPH|nr:HU family DNA-binding protein [Candidatus Liberibacter americanus]AHA27584.1 Bacterial nucleoid DNA-binding protein [Candidatus Liberibacter americanus str. Sao Paulo]EMS36455.1 integration host factor, beta subunit [Candidatus Liberibacter americanus PW_SP]